MMEQNHGPEDNEQNPDRRITVEDARRMLGMIGNNYDNEDIVDVLEVLYGIAEEAFEKYLSGVDIAQDDQ